LALHPLLLQLFCLLCLQLHALLLLQRSTLGSPAVLCGAGCRCCQQQVSRLVRPCLCQQQAQQEQVQLQQQEQHGVACVQEAQVPAALLPLLVMLLLDVLLVLLLRPLQVLVALAGCLWGGRLLALLQQQQPLE
jgi:hypothetical protein